MKRLPCRTISATYVLSLLIAITSTHLFYFFNSMLKVIALESSVSTVLRWRASRSSLS